MHFTVIALFIFLIPAAKASRVMDPLGAFAGLLGIDLVPYPMVEKRIPPFLDPAITSERKASHGDNKFRQLGPLPKHKRGFCYYSDKFKESKGYQNHFERTDQCNLIVYVLESTNFDFRYPSNVGTFSPEVVKTVRGWKEMGKTVIARLDSKSKKAIFQIAVKLTAVQARLEFAASLIKFVNMNGFQGLDLQVETPTSWLQKRLWEEFVRAVRFTADQNECLLLTHSS